MATEKNILLVSYIFPPLGMGGIGRSLALFKHLPEYGYKVTVLTVKDILYPARDYSLVDGVDEESIVRTGSIDPSRVLHLLGVRGRKKSYYGSSKAAFFYYPDSKRGWLHFAQRRAGSIVKKKNIAAVITTSPPPSAHIIGLKLKKSSPIAWVADFRDFWFSLPIELVYPTRIQRSYALRLKQKIVHSADEIVTVNSSIRDYLGRGEVIMNGADVDTARCWSGSTAKDHDRFTIGILGTINELCPVEPLFRAVASMAESDESILGKISIVHVGHCDTEMMNDILERYSLKSAVSLKGYLPRKEAIRTLALADMLYMAVAGHGRYNILPGRIFDYLMSGKPILGVVPPDSDAAALLTEYEYGCVVSHDDIDGMSACIRRLHDNRSEDGYSRKSEVPGNSKFSTVHTAEKYAHLLDRILK